MGTESLELEPQTAFDKSTSSWPYFVEPWKVPKKDREAQLHQGVAYREVLDTLSFGLPSESSKVISAYHPVLEWVFSNFVNQNLDIGLKHLRTYTKRIKKNLESLSKVQSALLMETPSGEFSLVRTAELLKPKMIEEDIEYDIVLHLPPKSETTMKVKLKFEGRGKPKIVESEEIDEIW